MKNHQVNPSSIAELHGSESSQVILVVDDCDYVGISLEICLSTLDDFRVVRACQCSAAYDVLSSTEISVAALITDLNFPVSSGFELIRLARKIERYENVPIIAISGEDSSDAIERCLGAGADSFLAKPYSMAELRNTLQMLLERSSFICKDAGDAERGGLVRKPLI